MSKLMIVESPAKAKTITKYLGGDFEVKASMGHLRDLPKKELGVDIDNGFEAKYIPIDGKGKVIKELKDAADKAECVYLATDPDREGEAISWHLQQLLDLDEKKTRRVTFNEITKNAVRGAVENPRDIDMDLVNAQQARRMLDRIVGYKLSPLLWRRVRSGLSAGRVQSVVTRLVVDREREINAFVPEEYWSIAVKLEHEGKQFIANFHGNADGKLELHDPAETDKVLAATEGRPFPVWTIKKQKKKRQP
ncbi:MAG: DNA topoisomerase I, partial [Clostridia bacterium]|nr:DNA topoisomerase I [Clostridia bacterium]